MPTKIILVRHGETVWNNERRSQGFSDIPLSPVGEEQAKDLAKALRKKRIDAVYSSDLIRSKKTADIIAAPHKIMAKMDVRLRELNQGELEGQKLETMLSEHPDLLKQWMDSPADVTMPGGESLTSLQARCWRAVEDIVGKHTDQTVVVVAHNLANLSIICRAIGLDLNRFRSLKMNNASISVIEFHPGRGPVLTRLNETGHLC